MGVSFLGAIPRKEIDMTTAEEADAYDALLEDIENMEMPDHVREHVRMLIEFAENFYSEAFDKYLEASVAQGDLQDANEKLQKAQQALDERQAQILRLEERVRVLESRIAAVLPILDPQDERR